MGKFVYLCLSLFMITDNLCVISIFMSQIIFPSSCIIAKNKNRLEFSKLLTFPTLNNCSITKTCTVLSKFFYHFFCQFMFNIFQFEENKSRSYLLVYLFFFRKVALSIHLEFFFIFI